MSKEILKERCQQLQRIENTIEKVNHILTTLDCSEMDRETYWEKIRELGETNQYLSCQRKSCREAIILQAMAIYS